MKKAYFLPILILILFTACQPAIETFYWGDYSVTLYDYKKNPDAETLKAHKDQILQIFEQSIEKNKKVPPGVNAEYGYILLKEGKEEEGMDYLDKEMDLYPESKIFLERIKMEYNRGKK